MHWISRINERKLIQFQSKCSLAKNCLFAKAFCLLDSATLLSPPPRKSVILRPWFNRFIVMKRLRRDWLVMALRHVHVACLGMWAGLCSGPVAYVSRVQHAIAMTTVTIDRLAVLLCKWTMQWQIGEVCVCSGRSLLFMASCFCFFVDVTVGHDRLMCCDNNKTYTRTKIFTTGHSFLFVITVFIGLYSKTLR